MNNRYIINDWIAVQSSCHKWQMALLMLLFVPSYFDYYKYYQWRLGVILHINTKYLYFNNFLVSLFPANEKALNLWFYIIILEHKLQGMKDHNVTQKYGLALCKHKECYTTILVTYKKFWVFFKRLYSQSTNGIKLFQWTLNFDFFVYHVHVKTYLYLSSFRPNLKMILMSSHD